MALLLDKMEAYNGFKETWIKEIREVNSFFPFEYRFKNMINVQRILLSGQIIYTAAGLLKVQTPVQIQTLR